MGKKNRTIPAIFNKTISYDFFPGKNNPNLTVIFIHGFKGFKDWGPWDLVAQKFAGAGFNFIKANLSHNGINLSQDQYEITDLYAFANNNFSIELNDISRIVSECRRLNGETKEKKICIIGHSRGGALSILSASHDPRINVVITWASPSNFENHFFAEDIPQWEKTGVQTIKNGRNGEDLPLRYQLYQDYILNHSRLHIPSRLKKITQPFLAIHGDKDETVPITSLGVLKEHCRHVKTHTIKGAGHTFGASHPWGTSDLPPHLAEVLDLSINFLKEQC